MSNDDGKHYIIWNNIRGVRCDYHPDFHIPPETDPEEVLRLVKEHRGIPS